MKAGWAGVGNSGPDPEDVAARRAGGDAGEGHGNEAARLPFEQQQFDGQQHGRNRRGESSRHAARGARHQQCLALHAGQPEELGDHGPECAAGHDDRPFGAERSAGADGDGAGERLQDGHFGLHAAAVDQDGFEGFGDAVAADLLRAVAGHESDDQRAPHRHRYLPKAKMVAGGRDQVGRAQRPIEKQVGHEADQAQERQRHTRR